MDRKSCRILRFQRSWFLCRHLLTGHRAI